MLGKIKSHLYLQLNFMPAKVLTFWLGIFPYFIQTLCFLCIYWTENQVKKCHQCKWIGDSAPYFIHMTAIIVIICQQNHHFSFYH